MHCFVAAIKVIFLMCYLCIKHGKNDVNGKNCPVYNEV